MNFLNNLEKSESLGVNLTLRMLATINPIIKPMTVALNDMSNVVLAPAQNRGA
jgi:hypothetical protein